MSTYGLKSFHKLLWPLVILQVLYNVHNEIFFHLTKVFDHQTLD